MSFSEWKEVKLGDICNFQKGYAFKSKDYQVHGRKIIKVSNLNNYSVDLSECVCIEECKADNHQQYQLCKDDIIITTVGSWPSNPNSVVGKVIKVQQEVEKSLLNQNAVRVRGEQNIDQKFLFFSLKNKIFFEYIIGTAQGAANQASITQNDIKNYQFDLPQLHEQKAIAKTLSCLDDKIELNNRINKTLEEMAKVIFNSWFVDFEPFQESEFEDSELGRIPNGWRVGTLDECIDFYNGYAFKSKELLNCEAKDCYKVFKMGHIKKGGGLNYDGTRSWIEKNKCESILKHVLKTGDLLMCMTDMKGNVALLAHTALMNESDKYIVNQRVGLLKVNNKLGIDFPYLYILTNSNAFIENLRGRANSGVQVNLSTSEIKASKLIIAPIEVNKKFNEAVIPMFQQMFEAVKENQILTAIRDSILPKLMNGEIRVPIEENVQ